MRVSCAGGQAELHILPSIPGAGEATSSGCSEGKLASQWLSALPQVAAQLQDLPALMSKSSKRCVPLLDLSVRKWKSPPQVSGCPNIYFKSACRSSIYREILKAAGYFSAISNQSFFCFSSWLEDFFFHRPERRGAALRGNHPGIHLKEKEGKPASWWN